MLLGQPHQTCTHTPLHLGAVLEATKRFKHMVTLHTNSVAYNCNDKQHL